MIPARTGPSRPGNRTWLRPGIVLVVVVMLALGAATAATKLLAHAAPATRSSCVDLVVPAYFAANYWAQASSTKPAPADMILDLPNGVGAGTAPDPSFQALVRQAKAADITILGYSSTVDGARPMAEVEADVRHYRNWYGVSRIFLDRVSGDSAHLGYYRQLSEYIHQQDSGPSVWLNPGDFPDQSYMSIGDVVMVFEGTYAQYRGYQAPTWVADYPAAKFAHTIYDTPGSDLASALKLAGSRRAMHVYVTDGTGGNPYAALPSYWSRESAAGCGAGPRGDNPPSTPRKPGQ